jgi:peptidoglycan hydrolase-like protein with peptidoglycan-binding domain
MDSISALDRYGERVDNRLWRTIMHQPHLQRRQLFIVISLLLITSLACSLGGSQQAATQAPPPQPQGTPLAQNVPPTQAPIIGQPTITTAPQPTAQPTTTPIVGSGPGGCVLNAAFVADLTIPDDTVFAPNASFVKTWRIKNTGTCTWDAGYQLIFAEGNQMSGPAGVPINVTAPGANLDVSVNLKAPAAPSATPYKGVWTLKASNSVIFGGKYTVIIVVPLTPTAEPTIAPTVAPTTAPTLDWPLLRQGDTGGEVFVLQYLLNGRGAAITVDGIFGVGTRSAVVAYQDSRGLTKDGVVGPNTWTSLTSSVLISQGSSGGDVRAAQYLLHNKFGYTDVAVDGSFGPKSDAAVRDFQTKNGLNADGIVGPKTWKALIAVP